MGELLPTILDSVEKSTWDGRGCTQLQVQTSRRGTKQMLGYDGSPCNTQHVSAKGKALLGSKLSTAPTENKKTTFPPKVLCIITNWSRHLDTARRGDRGQDSRPQAGLESKDRWCLRVMGIQGRLLSIMHFNSIVSQKNSGGNSVFSALQGSCSTGRGTREPKVYLAGR